jgi:hypothetical protein
VQTERALDGDALHEISERPLFTITPKWRHLVAGGADVATVTVTPTDPDGAPRSAAVVTASVKAGTGTLGPATKEGEATVFRVTPAAEPGTMVVELAIDGVPVGVRPRLFWDAKP